LAEALKRLGYKVVQAEFVDTIAVEVGDVAKILEAARAKKINLRTLSATRIGVALAETPTLAAAHDVLAAFAFRKPAEVKPAGSAVPAGLVRTTPFRTHP